MVGRTRTTGQLREKINNYTMFILDEGLLRAYPETAGHSLCIQLDCATAPNAEAQNLIDTASERLVDYSIRFTVKLSVGRETPPGWLGEPR
jgi:hypothetical protein